MKDITIRIIYDKTLRLNDVGHAVSLKNVIGEIGKDAILAAIENEGKPVVIKSSNLVTKGIEVKVTELPKSGVHDDIVPNGIHDDFPKKEDLPDKPDVPLWPSLGDSFTRWSMGVSERGNG